MHFQTSVPDWPTALLKMPDDCLVKSLDNPDLLREAYQLWTAAGRDPARLHLDFRKSDLYLPLGDWESLKDQWRAQFLRFVDQTYLDNHAPYITLVEEHNEYTDSDMVFNKTRLQPAIDSARAAVAVWNSEFRGHSTIRSDCRLVICNSPVGNDVPREFYELAVMEDAVLGVHPYTHWQFLARDPGDWRWHSGRWSFNESEYNLHPMYAFTECGPYASVEAGWRHPDVCGGQLPLLIDAMRLWCNDLQSTEAYRDGRILGPGAWFTSYSLPGWDYYKLWEPELSALADMFRSEWNPGDNMDALVRTKLLEHVAAMGTILEAKWWELLEPPYKLAATGAIIPFYNADGSPRTVAPTSRAITGNWDVFQRVGHLLRVTNFQSSTRPDWWVKAETVSPL